MPTYDYECSDCGGFAAFRTMATRDAPAPCPTCRGESPRVLVARAPRLALMEGSTRGAMEINERSRHAPLSSKEYARLRHPAGCACCTSGRRGATVTAGNGAKAFPGKRPWMISH
jgi:putative FmdB family regulatory protein